MNDRTTARLGFGVTTALRVTPRGRNKINSFVDKLGSSRVAREPKAIKNSMLCNFTSRF